ncbi:uncharacterized protein N7482_006693 [Penicillium canariense]|uniref:Uncharacterized protein n=1 Tax=Penicillium canariense TaxID=189055 RepID=A0A9W9HV99_9EURO|nr:uncharacterized protein N7482_006693 [Penicillium canariense]KAJ5159689.1 hypothetical protein N7482_006693 [Penicillium canariense]
MPSPARHRHRPCRRASCSAPKCHGDLSRTALSWPAMCRSGEAGDGSHPTVQGPISALTDILQAAHEIPDRPGVLGGDQRGPAYGPVARRQELSGRWSRGIMGDGRWTGPSQAFTGSWWALVQGPAPGKHFLSF